MQEKCTEEVLAHARNILQSSAHAAFQYGQYYDCIEQHSYTYNLVYLGVGDVNAGIYAGLCLPEDCTRAIVEDSVNGVLALLGLPYDVYEVHNDIQDYQFPFTWVFYATVLILVSMVGVTLYASLFDSKVQALRSVSIQASMKVLVTKESQLNVFNGVRVMAMMWVVFGHYYFNTLTAGITNVLSIGEVFKQPFLLLVEAGLLSVDIFFFLGGFFLAFVFMREKAASPVKYLLAVLQRALRIWPAYIVTMMAYYSIFMHLGEGPRWPSYEPVTNICSSMWRSIFFVENLVHNGEEMCLDWGWYLQVDFQIFMACLLLLFLYRNVNKALSYVTGGALVVGSWIFTIYYTQVHNQKLFTDLSALVNFRDFYLDVYIKPYGRWAPYLMGLYLGIAYFEFQQSLKRTGGNHETGVLHRLKERLESRRVLRVGCEWLGISLMAFLTFIPRTLQTGHEWPQIWHSLFGCFEKPLFILGMLMVVLPTILGCPHSFFTSLLDNKLLNFLAKISFCTYLVHLMVIIQFANSRTSDCYYSILNAFPLYLGCLVVSCTLGFLMTLFIELPCSVWQKQLLNSFKGKGEQRLPINREEDMLLGEINRSLQSSFQTKI